MSTPLPADTYPRTMKTFVRTLTCPSPPPPADACQPDMERLRAVFDELLSDFAECARLLALYPVQATPLIDRDVADYRQAWCEAGGGEV